MREATAAHADPIVPLPSVHHQSAGLVRPQECIVIGVGADFALALRAPTGTMMNLKKVAGKMERDAFTFSVQQQVRAYKGQWTRDKLQVEMKRVELIGMLDVLLKQEVEQKTLPWMRARLDRLPPNSATPARDFTTIPVMKRSKPAGQFNFVVEDLLPACGPEGTSDPSIDLLICQVPKKAPRKETSLNAWKPVGKHGAPWNVVPGTLPVIAFNATHVVAVYATPGAGSVLTLEVGTLVFNEHQHTYRYERAWRYGLPPPVESGAFGANVRISPGGTIAVALRNVIYVAHATEAPGRTLVLRMLDHVLVTALWLCDVSRSLTWATQRGECFQWQWNISFAKAAKDAQASCESDQSEARASDPDPMEVMLTPLEEPVLAVYRDAASGGRFVAQTFMSVVGRLTPGVPTFKSLPMERPLAFATRGAYLYVLNKYGKLDVYRPGQKDSPLRGLLKVDETPPLVQQYAYDGLYAYEKENALAALMPNGTLHYFEWEK